MNDNERLYSVALQAIMDLFRDRTVSQDKAHDNLTRLRDEIDILLDSLE